MEIEKSVQGTIGESLILTELLKRGHEAYIAHGPTQKGWDTAIISDQSVKLILIGLRNAWSKII